MREWKWAEQRPLGYFLLAGGLILFFNLWARSLENHGYLRYAEIAREMIRSGDWIVPRYNGEIYIDKPPLLLWLIAIPSSLYGSVTPLLARLPSFLAAWFGLILTFFLGKRIYGTVRAGLLAGGVLLSSCLYFIYGRLERTDILLCTFVLGAFYFFLLGYRVSGKRRFLYHGLCFFFIGLGTMTKGPFGIVIPLAVIAAFLIKERTLNLFLSKPFLFGYGILVVTVLPWILLFIDRVGLDNVITLVKENRILSQHAPFYFYVYQIWALFFPWSLLLPFLGYFLWRERKTLWHSEESFFLVWFGVVFLLLTAFKFRTARYLLPSLPPLALMIGGRWEKRFSFFLLPILISVLLWHGLEMSRIRKDGSHSPGRMLVEQLKPLLKEATLSGYRLDEGTLEEVNFYLDRVIPKLKNEEELLNPPVSEKNRLVLMPEKQFEAIRVRERHSLIFLQAIEYKKGRLVLVSQKP